MVRRDGPEKTMTGPIIVFLCAVAVVGCWLLFVHNWLSHESEETAHLDALDRARAGH
jgi:hypothetical protein